MLIKKSELNLKNLATSRNTNIERPKWDFGPTSLILCHNSVGAVAYVVPEEVRACARLGNLVMISSV
jgi:hypothetical protein